MGHQMTFPELVGNVGLEFIRDLGPQTHRFGIQGRAILSNG